MQRHVFLLTTGGCVVLPPCRWQYRQPPPVHGTQPAVRRERSAYSQYGTVSSGLPRAAAASAGLSVEAPPREVAARRPDRFVGGSAERLHRDTVPGPPRASIGWGLPVRKG